MCRFQCLFYEFNNNSTHTNIIRKIKMRNDLNAFHKQQWKHEEKIIKQKNKYIKQYILYIYIYIIQMNIRIYLVYIYI